MADTQEIKNIVEGVIAKVFDKRMSELRKDLHRGVGESLGSRVSELQLDVETGVSDVFTARVEQVRNQISKGVSDVLNGQIHELRKEIEHGVTEVVHARAGEIRKHIEQGMGEVLGARATDLRKEIESGVSGVFEQRITQIQKDIERIVAETAHQRLAELRQEVEKIVEGSAERRIADLRKDVERVVSENAEHRVEELRKDVHRVAIEVAEKRVELLRKDVDRVVAETADQRVNDLRKDVERIVGEVAENRVASIRKDVEKVVAEAGEQRVQELRNDLSHKVTEELEPALKGKAQEAPVSALLQSAVTIIQQSSSQTDILRALLDGAAHFSSRVALFVIKNGQAAGWQARGFDDNNSIKKISVDAGAGLAGKAISERTTASGAAGEFDGKFQSHFGAPLRGHASLIPLLVRDKIPALIYADAGPRSDGESDVSAMQMLVSAAGLWLEILALRKSASGSMATVVEAPPEPPAATAEEASAQAEAVVVPEPEPEPVTVTHGAAASAPAPAHAQTAVQLTPAEEEIHKKARRFAKLLVDEIKLYNQSKVNEGRTHKDLYARLKDDIEKSRSSYEKRYGNSSAASADYFTQEVIKILAENDLAVLGSGFPR